MNTIKARPTTYNGISMRSRLEAAYAQYLDNKDQGWTYEPECFADSTGQYLPDFWVYDEEKRGRLIEVKPESILKDQAQLEAALARMEIIWSTHPEASLALVVGHDTPLGPRFWTYFEAHGAGDRLWRVRSYDLRLPMVWDRKDTSS